MFLCFNEEDNIFNKAEFMVVKVVQFLLSIFSIKREGKVNHLIIILVKA